MLQSYIIYKVQRYNVKGKQILNNTAKYYVSDIGLRYYLLGTKNNDQDHILENIVYLELIRRGYEVYIGKINNVEVDFIAINQKGREYHRVALSVLDETVLKRELHPLQCIPDQYPKYLLTLDYLPSASYEGINQIKINVLEWLLK